MTEIVKPIEKRTGGHGGFLNAIELFVQTERDRKGSGDLPQPVRLQRADVMRQNRFRQAYEFVAMKAGLVLEALRGANANLRT